MTTLNSRLQLALLNRKKGRNLIEQGFTLVELMIVIVIVGILSAVALPNFLSQTQKAKLTECKSQLSAQLKQVGAEYVNTGTTLGAVEAVVNVVSTTVTPSTAVPASGVTIDALSNSSNAGIFKYSTNSPNPGDEAIIITCQAWESATATGATNPVVPASYPNAEPADDLKGGGLFGCVNLTNGQIKISEKLINKTTSISADPSIYKTGGQVCGTTVFTTASLL